jgi:Lon protease-like protein
MDRIPLFPLSSGLFPDGMLQLQIFEVRYLDMIRRCEKVGTPFGVVGIAQGREVQVPGETVTLQAMGTLAHIVELTAVQPALLQVVCKGSSRFVLDSYELGPYGVWYGTTSVVPHDEALAIPATLQPMANYLGQWIARNQKQGAQHALPIFAPYRLDECGWVANRWAEMLPIAREAKQQMLAERDPLERLRMASQYVDFE